MYSARLGFRTALFFTCAYARLIRPALAQLVDPRPTAACAGPSSNSSWPSTGGRIGAKLAS